jgi:hypothetical protein
MKSASIFALCMFALFLNGCKKENITQVIGPKDWQPPAISWITPPDAELRGTVGVDVSVRDSSQIARVVFYFDGREKDTLTVSPWRFAVNVDSATIGVHLLEARAWDQYGNMGVSPILRVYMASGIAEGIRLLWVPDNFARIQDAINAAQDFDTIRVRDGIYYETLNTFGKGIWIESEHGPMRCKVDDDHANNAFLIASGQHAATIRGFWIRGSGYLISIKEGGQAAIFNNIVESDSADGTLLALNCSGTVVNNLFTGSWSGVQIGYMWGTFYNNILENVAGIAFWNMSLLRNPVQYGYNLFWNNLQNYNDRFPPGIGDLYASPMLDLTNGTALPGSPVIDSGNPDIFDRNNSRSDIGPFGGPTAY